MPCDEDNPMADYEFARGWSELRYREAVRVPIKLLEWQHFETSVEILSTVEKRERHDFFLACAHVVSADSRIVCDTKLHRNRNRDPAGGGIRRSSSIRLVCTKDRQKLSPAHSEYFH